MAVPKKALPRTLKDLYVYLDDKVLDAPLGSIADIAVDANGTAIAAAVNALIARLVAAGIIEENV